jgi:hypothetical protein
MHRDITAKEPPERVWDHGQGVWRAVWQGELLPVREALGREARKLGQAKVRSIGTFADENYQERRRREDEPILVSSQANQSELGEGWADHFATLMGLVISDHA